MTRIERQFDVPIPLPGVEEQWRRVQARRRAEVRFSAIDEQHTRVSVSADSDELDHVTEDLRRAGLAGREAAGNPGSLGDAPGPGGGKPGTTP